jgi:hypothetical protein
MNVLFAFVVLLRPFGWPRCTGYFDDNIFVFVDTSQWAVGRCTGPNNINTPGTGGICTLSNGFDPLAEFTARINVTYSPGGNGSLYAWDGPYRFNPLPGR